MSGQRSIVSSAKLIAICTLASRITGLVRDILLARAFGLAWVQDAWTYAFQFPNLFRRLLGEGAMAAAFVPTFMRTMETDGREAAWRLLARTLALMTVALSALIVVLAAVIGLIWWLSSGTDEILAARRLLLTLTALMLPFMLSICVLALFSSILNCVGSFAPAALAPVLLNIGMIFGLAVLGPWLRPHDDQGQVYVIAFTVVAAGVVQIAYILPFLKAYGVHVGWQLDASDPAVRRMLRLLVPVILGQGVLVVGVFLDAQVCIMLTHKAGTPEVASLLGWTFRYPLEEGALSAVTYAQRLYQFPLGVLVISLATAALPAFSRLASREDWPAWMAEVRQTLRLSVFEGVIAGAVMIVLDVPIMRLLFERGDFTAADTLRASVVLRWYGLGLWAFCAQHIVLRAFYSVSDVRTPLTISMILLPLNVALNVGLVWLPTVRESAFAISSCVTSGLSVIVGLAVLQRRTRLPVLDRTTLSAIIKMVLAAVVTGLIVRAVLPTWQHWCTPLAAHGHKLAYRVAETAGMLTLAGAIFVGLSLALRLKEVELLLAARLRRRSQTS